MTAYLMTRGTPRRLDYRFLGASPPQRWWAQLEEWIDLNEAEVVVHGGPTGACILISGIPSARRDAIGTVIRFTLVVDGVDPGLLVRLVVAGLYPTARTQLGSALDTQFPAEWVDAALAGTPPADDAVDTRLTRALTDAGGDAQTTDPVSSAPPSSWVGAAVDERAVSAFLDRVAELGAGADGWAFTTAGLTTVNGARRAAAALDVPVAILLGEGGPPKVVDLGKAPAGRRTGRTDVVPHRRRTRPALVISAVVLVVALLGLMALMIWISAATPASDPGVPPNSTSKSSTPAGSAGAG